MSIGTVWRPPTADSWTSLLAATMGFDGFGSVRVSVRGEAPAGGELRLVVQILGPSGVAVGAAQRVVTAPVLLAGVDLKVLHDAGPTDGRRVVAWVDENTSELEFGALTARPDRAVALASGRLSAGGVELRFVPALAAA